MDVDSNEPPMPQVPQELEFITLFELSPELFPWRDPRPTEIATRRAALSSQLIFDFLLLQGGVHAPATLYPPDDVAGLRRLLAAIEDSTYDALKKDCLIYYLLKWHHDGREEKFKDDRCIPPQFVALADAYWHLDSGVNIPRAVSLLSDARINQDYTSKVLQAISSSPEPGPLILKYVRTAKPLLIEPDDIDAYTISLAESSLMEAWHFQRTFPEKSETRTRLIRKILDWCLSPIPRAIPLKNLLAFPFSDYEQSLVHAYSLSPPTSLPAPSIPIIQDLVCVRLVHSGQYAAAVKLDRQFSNSSRSPSKSAKDRRKMMEEIIAVMPSAERRLLEADLEDVGGTTASGSGSRMGDNLNLSMSWESARGPRTVNGIGTPRRDPAESPTSLHSTAPRLPAANGHDPFLSSSTRQTFSPAVQTSAPLISSVLPQTKPISTNAWNSPSAFQSPFAAAPPPNPSQAPYSSFNTNSAGSPFANADLTRNALHNPLPPPTGSPSPFAFSTTGARSANFTPNAFYDPPTPQPGAVNGIKRSFGQSSSHAESAIHPVDGDVFMTTDEEGTSSRPTRARTSVVNDDDIAPVEYSLFSRPTKVTRTETERMLPPGAFPPEPGPPIEPVLSPPRTRTATRRQTQSSSKKPAAAPQRPTNFGRSLPGSLMDEDDEEGEDRVAPLPPTIRPATTRRTRGGSRASSAEPDESARPSTNLRPRRSTRLSVTPSSPERSSTQKVSVSNRAKTSNRTSGGRRK